MRATTEPSYSTSRYGLEVSVRLYEESAALMPRGEIDHGSVVALDDALRRAPAGLDDIVLDMAGVSFMDSAGLHFLDRLTCYGRRHEVPTQAVNWQGQPRRVLSIAGSYWWEWPFPATKDYKSRTDRKDRTDRKGRKNRP
ncbi:STAS domain-containing protein [Streptomyces sp. MST-110588]|uniref:STAS domain-containing protein n=1 Tax=Streptomyces sp. MST-110588 TaxID=2833628 RepID=UPI001F5C6637|nr:STAS domain-containing protein [Streptomyces sp. MST-110588]UNO38862.1 STAS domain-containing protein [Streptomyces sp. MST-110588]